MTTTARPRPILKLTKRKIYALLAQAWAIYHGMAANPALFPAPNPALAVLLALIQALEALQQANPRTTQGTAARNAKRDELVTALESERMYVQALCDASPEQASTLIAAAAMGAAAPPVYDKPALTAKLGPRPGSVILAANARLLTGKRSPSRVVFEWQLSADGGRTWTSAAPTPLATTVIDGLTPLTRYAFRVRVTVSKVTRDWSEAVTLLVP